MHVYENATNVFNKVCICPCKFTSSIKTASQPRENCTFQNCLLIIVPAYELLLHFQTDVRNQLVNHLHYSYC